MLLAIIVLELMVGIAAFGVGFVIGYAVGRKKAK